MLLRLSLPMGLVALLVAACTRGQTSPTQTQAATPVGTPTVSATVVTATARATGTGNATAVIVSGVFALPAASAFGAPGFHEVLIAGASARLPAEIARRPVRLVLSLRDLSRPGHTCPSDHPLSGCATVDWSDSPSRPKVPVSGVFENSLTIDLQNSPVKLFLSDSGSLQDRPVRFDPG